MGRRKLPKNCRDWHEDLIRCCEARYNRRASLGKRDYAQWMKARDLLRASQDHIYIQPTGENKVPQLNFDRRLSLVKPVLYVGHNRWRTEKDRPGNNSVLAHGGSW
jgi:hypothetical protein